MKDFLARIWRSFPTRLRRLSMRLVNTRFTATAGAIVLDSNDRVLLLQHRFRGGSGWGIPGGFIKPGEQPHEAMRRELREEVGLEVMDVRIVGSRTFKKVKQIEILFCCRTNADAEPRSAEIKKADWFSLDQLPPGLPREQERLLRSILVDGANYPD
jgi:ADP-ribose pyrophosphatase YjhB (NUDIX family)